MDWFTWRRNYLLSVFLVLTRGAMCFLFAKVTTVKKNTDLKCRLFIKYIVSLRFAFFIQCMYVCTARVYHVFFVDTLDVMMSACVEFQSSRVASVELNCLLFGSHPLKSDLHHLNGTAGAVCHSVCNAVSTPRRIARHELKYNNLISAITRVKHLGQTEVELMRFDLTGFLERRLLVKCITTRKPNNVLLFSSRCIKRKQEASGGS